MPASAGMGTCHGWLVGSTGWDIAFILLHVLSGGDIGKRRVNCLALGTPLTSAY